MLKEVVMEEKMRVTKEETKQKEIFDKSFSKRLHFYRLFGVAKAVNIAKINLLRRENQLFTVKLCRMTWVVSTIDHVM